jgi:uroporphyrinogen decarboxylase
MNSKERVKSVMSHSEPDRVPLHLNATKWVVAKLKMALNVSSDRDLLKSLNIDFYDMRGIDLHSGVAPKYIGPPNDFFPAGWKGAINSFWGIQEFENKTISGWTMEMGPSPLANAPDLKEMENYTWPENKWYDYSNVRKELDEWKDFSLIATGASIFQHPTFVRGTDKLMMDMMLSPDIANYLFDKFFYFYYEYYRRMFEEAGDLIDIFALADDLGMQNTLLISPEMFEEYVAPRLKKMVDLAHNYDIKILLHTCGNVEVIIPRFIDLGVDILDPVQPECMDPVEIKNKYGKDICLRGGISVQNIVSKGTVAEVKAESKRIVEALMKGGGYIFAPGHPVLQDDIPVENILAMYEAGNKFGYY